jgi:hypothetical protein
MTEPVAPSPRPAPRRSNAAAVVILVGIAIVAIIAILARTGPGDESPESFAPPPSSPVNRANFERVATGMIRSEVEAILGPGRLTMSSGSGSNEYWTYQWDEPDGLGFIIVSFEGGRVVSRSATGID